MLDDEIRPTLERNVFGKERLYLARNIVMVENGNLALVQLHYLLLFRRDDLDILPHFVVHLLVIHYDGTERTVQRIAQDGIGPIHLAEQQRRRFERLDIPKHLLPFIDKGSYILTYIRFVLALRGGTYYHTVILGQYRQGYLLEPLALFRRANLLGDGNLVRERNEHHVPPCKGDVRRKPGSFRGDGFFGYLHHDGLSRGEQVGYLAGLADGLFEFERVELHVFLLRSGELSHELLQGGELRTEVEIVYESVLFVTYVHECRIQTRHYFANPTQIDIAYRESGLYTLLTKLDQPFVLREGYGYLTFGYIDNQFPVHLLLHYGKPQTGKPHAPDPQVSCACLSAKNQ